jgi:protein PhnA
VIFMSIEQSLAQRAGQCCELCGSGDELAAYFVAPVEPRVDKAIFACGLCRRQIDTADNRDPNHWRCLNGSMWSTEPAVQVVAWRMLNRLSAEGWPQELLEQMYLDDETLAWARAEGDGVAESDRVIHKDCHGTVLEAGDTVTLIKDLDVKGANFTAKRGTAVRGISLVADNADQIEGRVSGQRIVILCEFVKRSA